MKNIKKLILPLACVAASGAIVAPLVTSCDNVSTVADTDVTHGYNPSIEKHAAVKGITTARAKADYIDAIRKNPNIVSEDYKYFGSEVNQFLQQLDLLFKSQSQSNGWSSFWNKFSYSVKSFSAGLKNFVMDEYDRVSYTSGMAGRFSVEFNFKDSAEEEEEAQSYTLHIDANLSVTGAFKNFAGFDVKHGSSLFEKNLTFIRPIWPKDLNQEDWSLGLTINGALKATLNGISLLDVDNIDINKTFNYKDRTILSKIPLNFLQGLIPGLLRDTYYLMDFLTFLGAFSSYYMSDVQIAQHLQAMQPIQLVPIIGDPQQIGYFHGISYLADVVFQMEEECTNWYELNQHLKFKPLNDSSTQHDIDLINEDFAFMPYVDEMGKQHNDKCVVKLLVTPEHKTQYMDELEYKIVYQQSDDSYEWTEKHGDKYIINNTLIYDDTTDPQKVKSYTTTDSDSLSGFEGAKFSLSIPLTNTGLKQGSTFGVYYHYYEEEKPWERICQISIDSITVDGKEFTDYTMVEGVVIFNNETEIPQDSIVNITFNYNGLPIDPFDSIEGIPMLIPAA